MFNLGNFASAAIAPLNPIEVGTGISRQQAHIDAGSYGGTTEPVYPTQPKGILDVSISHAPV